MDKKIKVAIADDHALFRKGLAQILSGYENIELLFQAKNGKELIEKIGNLPPKGRPDVCIVDINMPVMNGYDATKIITNNYPKIKVLALSMYDDEQIIIKMFHCGAHSYVLKDIEPDELRKAIHSVHTTGVYDSDIVTNEVLKGAKVPGDDDDVIFTEKEMDFLRLCCSEMTYKEIAEKMGVSHRTVDGYRDNLFSKLNLKSRTGLVIYAFRTGLIATYK